MEILLYGNGPQSEDWNVKVDTASDFSRIYYVLGGSATYRDAYSSCNLEINKLYVFPSYAPYTITHNPNNPINCCWAHLDLYPLITKKLYIFDPEENDILKGILLSLTSIMQRQESSNLTLLLIEALSGFISENIDESIYDGTFFKILSYIKNNCFSPDFSVEAASGAFGYTPAHFIRIFKKNLNITPYQYVTSQRMLEASRLLFKGYSIKEISEKVGYRDQKLFSKIFKKHFSVSPSYYSKYYHFVY